MADDAPDYVRLQSLLQRHLSKIPPGVQHGTWNIVQDYKAWVKAAKKAVRTTNEQTLHTLIKQYEAF